MNFGAFEAVARKVWDEIPAGYREGVDGLVVERNALRHPDRRGIYTLGECRTEEWPSGYEGPETTRSVLVLYWGSFRQLARDDPDFDWQAEIWETVTHELRHHLESLASEDALEDVDYAAEENFKRQDGAAFDPFFFRAGDSSAPGVYEVDEDVFIERPLPPGAPPATVEFRADDRRYRVRVPADPGDVCFLLVTRGLPRPRGAGTLTIVLTRRRGWRESLRGILQRRAARVVEGEVAAEPA